MKSDDRMDEALRAIAHSEASRDFTTRVRARLEEPYEASTAWPRIAAAFAAVLLLAASAWLLQDAPSSRPEHGRATLQVAPLPLAAGLAEPTSVVAEGRPAPVRAPRRRRSLPKALPSDHERALDDLAGPSAMTTPGLTSAPIDMPPLGLASLKPVDPLPLGVQTAGAPGKGDGR